MGDEAHGKQQEYAWGPGRVASQCRLEEGQALGGCMAIVPDRLLGHVGVYGFHMPSEEHFPLKINWP